jgi:hypothetical protein
MKIKSTIVLKEEEMSAINKVIGMINFLTDGENILISEYLKEDGCCQLDDVRETLITLREMCEVEEECPKMF